MTSSKGFLRADSFEVFIYSPPTFSRKVFIIMDLVADLHCKVFIPSGLRARCCFSRD